MRGPTDVLMREGPVGPSVALAHHTLAHKVDPAHDEEREDDADDGPDGTAVGRAFVQGRLVDFCRRTDRKRGSTFTAKEQAPLWVDTVGPGGTGSAWGQHSLTEGRKEGMLGCWGRGAMLTSVPPTRCPPGLPGAPSFLSSPPPPPFS